MTQVSDYAEDNFQDLAFRNQAWASPTTVYVALFTTAPDDSGGGVEASGGAYVREPIAFDAPSSGVTQNTDIETWTGTAAHGTVVAWGIFDAVTVGNLLFWDTVDTSQPFNVDDTVRFSVGALIIQHAASPQYTIFLQDAMLDHILRNSAYTPAATVYFALHTGTTTEAGGGTEVTGSGYARLAATFAASSGGVLAKSGTYEWVPSGGNYGTVTDAAVWDAVSAGNMLSFDEMAAARVVNDTDTFELTQFDITLD